MDANKLSNLNPHSHDKQTDDFIFLSRKQSHPTKPIFKSTSSMQKIEEKSKSSDEVNSEYDKNSNERQGRWLQSEHFRFLKGCLLYGNNWGKVKDIVKSRSSAQIRSHAQKYLIKLCKKYRNHPFFSSKAKCMSGIFQKEDYIFEDYEIFPEEKIQELQIFAGIENINEAKEKAKDFNLNSPEREKKLIEELSNIEKIEAAILGIFKCSGSKNLSELDLVESLVPRSVNLSVDELKILENMGFEDKSLQVTRRRSSLKFEKRKEKDSYNGISNFSSTLNNLSSLNNYYPESTPTSSLDLFFLRSLELNNDLMQQNLKDENKKPLFKVTKEQEGISSTPSESIASSSNFSNFNDMLQKQMSNAYSNMASNGISNINELNLNISNNHYYINQKSDTRKILNAQNENLPLINPFIINQYNELSHSNIQYTANGNVPQLFMKDFIYDSYIQSLAQQQIKAKQNVEKNPSSNEKTESTTTNHHEGGEKRVKNRANSSFIPITKEDLQERKSFHMHITEKKPEFQSIHINDDKEELKLLKRETQILIHDKEEIEKSPEKQIKDKEMSFEMFTSLIKSSKIDIDQIEKFILELKAKESS